MLAQVDYVFFGRAKIIGSTVFIGIKTLRRRSSNVGIGADEIAVAVVGIRGNIPGGTCF